MEECNSNWAPTWSEKELRALQRADPVLCTVIHWMETDSVPISFPHFASQGLQTLWTQRQQLRLENGLLYRRWEDVPGGGKYPHLQLILPQELIPTVLTSLHTNTTAGHLGITKTLQKVRIRFYWPGQRRDVEDWCSACKECSARKSPTRPRHAPLQTDLSGTPFQRVAMDILGPLPQTDRGHIYILVVGDYFTKWTEAIPIPNQEAHTVAEALVQQFICRFGAPDWLHTDQGRNFEANLMAELCKLLGITKTRTTPYHPQSDGMIERFNRTLLNMLSTVTGEREHDWDCQLPLVMMAYRTSINESTGATPYYLMFGREARLPIDVIFGIPPGEVAVSPSQHVLDLRKRLEDAYHRVRSQLGLQQRRHKMLYDRKVSGSPYKLHDRVWLPCPAVQRGKSPKFHRPWQGPYQIIKVISDVLYRIQLLSSPRRRVVVHFDRLKPYKGSEDGDGHVPTRSNVSPSNPAQQHLTTDDDEYIDTVGRNQSNVPAQETDQAAQETNQDTADSTPADPSPDVRRSARVSRPPERYGNPIIY